MTGRQQQQVLRAQLTSKAVLRPEELELHELTQLAGLQLDQDIFKILLDLLKMNVSPEAIVLTLRSMCSPHSDSGPQDSSRPYTSATLGSSGEPYAHVTMRDSSRHYNSSDSRSYSGERNQSSAQDSSRVRGTSSSSRVNSNAPDSFSSQHRQRQTSKKSSSTSSSYNVDDYVTRRPRSTIDASTLDERERANKKRYSQR